MQTQSLSLQTHLCTVWGKSPQVKCPNPNTKYSFQRPAYSGKVNSLVRILEGYEEAKLAYIREGFTVGFPLGCVGIPDTKLSQNHRSAEQHPEVINDFISKGKIEGKIAGPFLSPPFEPFITSPLGGNAKI